MILASSSICSSYKRLLSKRRKPASNFSGDATTTGNDNREERSPVIPVPVLDMRIPKIEEAKHG
jgi:hypothetical protein